MSRTVDPAAAGSAPGRRNLRSAMFSVHKWVGIHLSIYFGILLLSGALLTVGKELALVGRPDLWVPQVSDRAEAPLSEIYANLLADDPERRVHFVLKSATPWLSGEAYVSSPDRGGEVIQFDRYDATVLGPRPQIKIFEIIEQIHVALLVPIGPVSTLVNATSLVMLTMVATGLIAYRRFWRGFFRWPKRDMTERMRMGAYHRLVAVWIAPFLVVMAVTSSIFLLEDLGMQSAPEPPPALTNRDTALPPDFGPEAMARAEAAAVAAIDGFKPTMFGLPDDPAKGILIGGIVEEAPFLSVGSEVIVDPLTFEVLQATRTEELSPRIWSIRYAREIHYGLWGGRPAQLLWVAFGFIAGTLVLTGALVYAARTAPAAPGTSAVRRVWLGLGPLRWAYALLGAGMLLRIIQIAL